MKMNMNLNRYEAQFIQEIVKTVSEKLKRVNLHVPSYLVGIDTRLEHINSWLEDASNDKLGIGIIYGIGGVGKTTLAKIAFNLHYERFDSCSFVRDVRHTSEQHNGLLRLQMQLFSDIHYRSVRNIYNKDEGIIMIRDAMKNKKALIVLGDVDDNNQLTAILGEWDRLPTSNGSKIIITTRHERLLRSHIPCKKFKVEPLNDSDSLQLFSWHAFRQEYPDVGYMENSKNVVSYCGGIPLALEVLASSLSGFDMQELRSALQEPEEIHDLGKIQRILRISYDSLRHPRDKDLFLDVACFYIGKKKYYVDKIVEECELYRVLGIQTLIDRYLITVDEDNKLMMHHLLRDMGREIVRQESPRDLGSRSRLWHYKDAFEGTESVRSLIFDQQQLTLSSASDQVELAIEAFVRMSNLIELINRFPTSLIWLCWHGFPFDGVPQAFSLENLVVLDLRNSNLKDFGEPPKLFPMLKILNPSHSHLLITISNFSGFPNLELLILKDCVNLINLDESIGVLDKVILLNLKDCINPRKLPKEIARMRSLEELILTGCSELNEIPEELVELEVLGVLDASGTAINRSNSISSRIASSLSTSFSFTILPRSVQILKLSNCNLTDDVIPNDPSPLPSLISLELSGNPIHTLPESIGTLTLLQFLSLDHCQWLRHLPELPESLMGLNLLGCKSLGKIKGELWRKMRHFGINGCASLLEMEGLYKLQPMTSNAIEIINHLHLFNLESLESNFEVEMINCQTDYREL